MQKNKTNLKLKNDNKYSLDFNLNTKINELLLNKSKQYKVIYNDDFNYKLSFNFLNKDLEKSIRILEIGYIYPDKDLPTEEIEKLNTINEKSHDIFHFYKICKKPYLLFLKQERLAMKNNNKHRLNQLNQFKKRNKQYILLCQYIKKTN